MKIKWTRTELKKFEEWRNLELDLMARADNAMWGSWSPRNNEELKEEVKERDKLEEELKSLMGTTRFNILKSEYSETMKFWEKEVMARYIRKHPWFEPDGYYEYYE